MSNIVKIQSRPDFTFDPSLVLYLPLWKRDGAAIASDDPYGRACTVTGALRTLQGRQFDGSDDVITIPASTSLKVENGFTVNAWFRTPTTLDVNQSFSIMDYISCNNTTGYCTLYVLAGSNLSGALKLSVYDGTNNPTATGTTNCRDNVWRMATAVWNKGDKVYAYLNAVLEGSNNDTITGTISGTGAGTPKIGGDYTNKAACTIGEVVQYNRALTATEITNLYLATKWKYQ